MKKKTLLILITSAILLVIVAESRVILAQDRAHTYVIEEVVLQNIYIDGFNGSIVLKVRIPKDGLDARVRVLIEQISTASSADKPGFRVIDEKNVTTREFIYYIYTVHIATDQKEFSNPDSVCRPLILNISLIGREPDLVHDNRLAVATVCSIKALEASILRLLRENIKEVNLYQLQTLEMLRIITDSLEGLMKNVSTTVNEVEELRGDVRKINSSIAIERDSLGKVVEEQSRLKLVLYVILASSSISLLLMVVLVVLISRVRKEQPVVGL